MWLENLLILVWLFSALDDLDNLCLMKTINLLVFDRSDLKLCLVTMVLYCFYVSSHIGIIFITFLVPYPISLIQNSSSNFL